MTDPLADLDFVPSKSACECPHCAMHPHGDCTDAAEWILRLHDVHGCNKPDLDPSGAAVRLVCGACLRRHTLAAEQLAHQARVVYAMTGGILACRTCQRPLTDVTSFLSVEAYGE